MATSPRLVAGYRDAQRSAESLFESQSIAQIREVCYAASPCTFWIFTLNCTFTLRWAGGDKG